MGAELDKSAVDKRLGPAFRYLWTATAGSSFGDGLFAVAAPLYAFQLTHSAVLVSAVYAMTRLPALVVAYPAGMLADRYGRRALALTSDLTRCVVVAATAATVAAGLMNIAWLCVAVFILSALEQLYQAATFAILPSMVAADNLVRANGRLWMADVTVEDLVGQGLGGLLLSIRSSLPFLVDALSFLWSAIFLRSALPPESRATGSMTVETEQPPPSGSALGWFVRQPTLRAMALLIGSFALFQAGVMGTIVVYLRRDLHISASGVGVVLAVAAMGTVFGAYGATRISERLGAVPALMIGGGIAAVSYLMLGVFRSVPATAFALALETGATNVGVISSVSLRQRLIPKELLGRVGMIMRTIIWAGMPIGAIAAGALATVMPLPQVFLLAGVLQLAVLAGWSLDWRRRAPGRPGAHFKRAERVGFEPTVP